LGDLPYWFNQYMCILGYKLPNHITYRN